MTRQVKVAGGAVAQDHLRMGAPSAEIAGLAEAIGARVIIMGSRRCGGMRQVLVGSVSDKVVRFAHCPVLMVRS